MNLVYGNASVFKKFVEGISVLVDEAEFVVDANGLSLKATDASQISLVDFVLPKKAFKVFDFHELVKLGVDLNYFSQVMSRAKANDSLALAIGNDNSKLSVIFAGGSKRTFSIPLLNLGGADLPMPRIDFDSEVKIMAGALQDSFKDAALISTHVVLSVENDSFVVKANSSKGNVENVYAQKDEQMVSLKAGEETRAMFPLDYLSNIVKAASSDTEVLVKLKSNAPVEISYSVGEGKLTYFLAPRIESD